MSEALERILREIDACLGYPPRPDDELEEDDPETEEP